MQNQSSYDFPSLQAFLEEAYLVQSKFIWKGVGQANAQRVLLALLADGKEVSTLSTRKLGKLLGMGQKTVDRARYLLTWMGWLLKVESDSVRGRGIQHGYRLMIPMTIQTLTHGKKEMKGESDSVGKGKSVSTTQEISKLKIEGSNYSELSHFPPSLLFSDQLTHPCFGKLGSHAGRVWVQLHEVVPNRTESYSPFDRVGWTVTGLSQVLGLERHEVQSHLATLSSHGLAVRDLEDWELGGGVLPPTSSVPAHRRSPNLLWFPLGDQKDLDRVYTQMAHK